MLCLMLIIFAQLALKAKRQTRIKGDEAELNTKWTICKVWLCKRERVLVVWLQGARCEVGSGWWRRACVISCEWQPCCIFVVS